VPVLDEGNLAGIISNRDVVEELHEELQPYITQG
jgi:CBS domain-containing protein